MTKADISVLREVSCPLCGAKGTLRPITIRRRLRAGLLSLLTNAGKTHECTRCGAKV